jgi:alpha-D-ribose 1-methylphosphonate 5-triphosphate synthase subunit PhnH
MEHDLFGKPVSTFPDHALAQRPAIILAHAFQYLVADAQKDFRDALVRIFQFGTQRGLEEKNSVSRRMRGRTFGIILVSADSMVGSAI